MPIKIIFNPLLCTNDCQKSTLRKAPNAANDPIIIIGNKIWKRVDRQILSNKECRNIHHTNLLKKYILLNDLKKSTTLLEQYKNAKYKNDNAYFYFCGAYQRQFDNLNYSPLMKF